MDLAHLGGQWAWSLEDLTSDVRALDGSGRWAVVLPYDGLPVLARFGQWAHDLPVPSYIGSWHGPAPDAWESSLGEGDYCAAVEQARQAIAAGTVFQANVCRVMSAPMPAAGHDDLAGLYALLFSGNPAPHAAFVRVAAAGMEIASASPELFLRREGDSLTSSPIKGTGRTAGDLQDKDVAENVMIVDLVRNDLSRVCDVGSVAVPALLRREQHPGLVHMVSDVHGRLSAGQGWPEILAATFPPGSVTGAPKSSALRLIDRLEAASRGVYCGAVGWVDADTRRASLAVAIRTFWRDGDRLRFGTGAGITWGSDPAGEWRETELKARRLIHLAGGVWQGGWP